jgi:hypothetical protein
MNTDEFLKRIEDDDFFSGIINKHEDFENYPVEPETCDICEEEIKMITIGETLCKCGTKLLNIRRLPNDDIDVGYFIIGNLPLIKTEYLKLSKMKPFNKVDNSIFLKEFHQWISDECLGGNTRWDFGLELENIIGLIENFD